MYSDSSFSFANINDSVVLVSFGIRGAYGGTRDGKIGDKGLGVSYRCGDFGGCGDLGEDNSVISCFYHKEPGHIKKFCPKLIVKNTQL